MTRPNIPCGKTLGHGESCVSGHMCDHCNYILSLEQELKARGFTAWVNRVKDMEDYHD